MVFIFIAVNIDIIQLKKININLTKLDVLKCSTSTPETSIWITPIVYTFQLYLNKLRTKLSLFYFIFFFLINAKLDEVASPSFVRIPIAFPFFPSSACQQCVNVPVWSGCCQQTLLKNSFENTHRGSPYPSRKFGFLSLRIQRVRDKSKNDQILA